MTDREVALLEKLSEKVGTAGGQAWDILVSAAFTSSLADCIQYALLGCVIAVYLRYFKKWMASSNTEPAQDIVAVLGGLIMLVFTLVAVCALHDTIMGFTNPQYWALDKLMATCGK